MTTLDVTIRRTATGATVDLTGDVDGGARATLDAAYVEAAPEGGSELLLNFGEVGYINSTGIALIVGILARARAEHVRIGACGLSDHYRGIFEITRLSDFMAIYPDEASALVGEQALPMAVRNATAGCAVIDIVGEVTAASESTLMDAYVRSGDAHALVLNFSGLEYMNSSGIGLLVTLLVRVQRQGRRLLAFGLTDHYRQIFELTRLDEAIEIHEDEAAALAAAT